MKRPLPNIRSPKAIETLVLEEGHKWSQGFTLVELLAVIGVIAIVASMLLPALGRARLLAEGAVCASNTKQFAYAWLQYVEDSHGELPPNRPIQGPLDVGREVWVKGWLNPLWSLDSGRVDQKDNTNTVYLRQSLLAPYMAYSVAIWRCPGDRSLSRHGGRLYPRVRTYSMNSYLGKTTDPRPEIRFRRISKMNELRAPDPSQTWIFIDEREDSIQDCAFVVDMENGPVLFLSVPAAYHAGAGSVSFADGHTERKRWTDPRMPPFVPGEYVNVLKRTAPVSPDVLWLQQRTTGLKR